jgi:hypothetical protein
MRGKLLVFGVSLLAVTLASVGFTTVKAVDASRDCDQYAVIKCGTLSASELRAEYSTNNGSSANGTTGKQADIQRVFSALGISSGELNGEFKDGVVYRDGTVKVGGKTVATGAVMGARNLGGTQIPNTNASKISVSAMSSAQTALVKLDANGKFLFAVMKPCGNPVNAQATKPPTPPTPQPQPSAVCKNLTVTPIANSSNTKFRLTAEASVSGGAKVKSYRFDVTSGGKTVSTLNSMTTDTKTSVTYSQATPGNYSARVTVMTSAGAKSGPHCVATFSVPKPPEGMVVVCNPSTRQTITVKQSEASQYKPVGSPECEDITVCDMTTNQIVTIKHDQFDSNRYTTDQTQCQPSQLPETGPAEVVMKLLGATSLTGASAYYITSRRNA